MNLAKIVTGRMDAASPADLYRAATLGGATALGRDDLGRLAAGALADIVVVDLDKPRVGVVDDPIRTMVYNCSSADLALTVVHGRTVVVNGEVTDGSDLEFKRSAQGLFEKMRASYGHRDHLARDTDALFATTETAIKELDGTRGGLTRVFVTPFAIVPSIYGSGPSTPHAAQRLTAADREHGAAVRDLARRTGTRIHSDAFGGHVRLALQDPESAILGPNVHLQHCVGLDDEEITMLAGTGTHASHAPGASRTLRR